MRDAWGSGEAYERSMGRWSRLVAGRFVAWLPVTSALAWLDVGCGSGALSEAVFDVRSPARLTAVDPSDGFVAATRQRLGPRVDCRCGEATALPLDDASVDVCVAGLVLNFVNDRLQALTEMRRVTREGGLVAVYVWDYGGSMDMLRTFWDAAVALDPTAASMHESLRFADANPDSLVAWFDAAGLGDVATTPLDVVMRFRDFDDYWQPLLGGQGPAPSYLQSLDEAQRDVLRKTLAQRLQVESDGTITLGARAWAAYGRVRG